MLKGQIAFLSFCLKTLYPGRWKLLLVSPIFVLLLALKPPTGKAELGAEEPPSAMPEASP